MIFYPKKYPNFARKLPENFFPECWGARAPLSPSPTPMLIYEDPPREGICLQWLEMMMMRRSRLGGVITMVLTPVAQRRRQNHQLVGCQVFSQRLLNDAKSKTVIRKRLLLLLKTRIINRPSRKQVGLVPSA